MTRNAAERETSVVSDEVRLEAPVRVVAYDARWPAQFEAERRNMLRLLQPWIVGSIEHVGSTAVRGLCAKARHRHHGGSCVTRRIRARKGRPPLKLDLAQKFELDREAYTDAKSPFIRRVLNQR